MNRDVRCVFVFARLLSVALLLLASGAHAATRWDNPLPQGNILADVAWNGTRYVAVGHLGTVLESTNGTQWRLVNSGTEAWLQTVRWIDGRFIAVGNHGTILSSADGLRWTRQASGTTSYLYGVEHAGSLIVAVGSSGTVLVSESDGRWTRVDHHVPDWLNDVAWNGSEFIAVGENGTILGSADGRTWTRRLSPVRNENPDGTASGPSLEGIAWSNTLGRWVAVAEIGNGPLGSAAYILTSENGNDWTAHGGGSNALHGVIWQGTQNLFVAVGDHGRVTTSADGLEWNTRNDTGWVESFESVVYGGSGYVAVGEHGIIVSAADPAGSWTRRTSGSLSALTGTALRGTGYVAVGRGVILHSADAIAGDPIAITRVQGGDVPDLRGIAAGTSGYVAVGRGGTVISSNGGATWSYEPTTAGDLNGVVQAGDGAWVAVGANGTIIRNSGQGWRGVRAGAEALNAIVADGNGLIAVGASGADGVILTSTNGTQWARRGVAGQPLNGVASGNGRRVAVGTGGTFFTQVNGNWVAGNVGTIYHLNAVAWDGLRFIAVGNEGMSFVSNDGLDWVQLHLTGNQMTGLAANADLLLVVGEGGTVVTSACPCATDDYATTTIDEAVRIPVLANDRGEALRLSGADLRSTQGGTIIVNGDGTLTYTPASGFSGTDLFNYTLGSATDPVARDTAGVTVEVSGGRGDGGSGGSGGGAIGLAPLLLLTLVALRRRGNAMG